MPSDFYDILGVSRDASAEDLKRAYRALSKEWHPDKHKGDKAAEQRFAEINHAYETLSDPKKRQMYDQFGSAGPGAGGPGGFDFNTFQGFADMGDLGDLFGSFFGGARGSGQRVRTRGDDVRIALDVALREAFSGATREVTLRMPVTCEACSGSGAAKGAAVVTCTTCSGTGQVTRTAQSFFGAIRQSVLCSDCQGTGKRPEKMCPSCHGEGRTNGKRTIGIRIPPGIATGQALRLQGEGGAGLRGDTAGDLLVEITVLPDPEFVRDGDDIRSVIDVPVIDALLGADLSVPTLHDAVTVRIGEGAQPGDVLRVKGKGMPILNTARFGDQYVELRVVVPKKLSRAERKLMEEWRTMRKG